MNTQQMKEDCEFCQQNGGVRLGVKIPEMLELIAAYEGAQFAAASHLRTVEQQAKIIAGMQAAPIQSGDVRNQTTVPARVSMIGVSCGKYKGTEVGGVPRRIKVGDYLLEVGIAFETEKDAEAALKAIKDLFWRAL